MDVSEDGCPDDGGNQRLTEEEKEKSTSTDQQTQESEVSLIRGLLLTVWLSTGEQPVKKT